MWARAMGKRRYPAKTEAVSRGDAEARRKSVIAANMTEFHITRLLAPFYFT
jgi:hypothetical protein